MVEKYKNIVILTGAGISAESGLATFRSADGLWNNHRVEDVATIEAYFRNPDYVHQFYNEMRPELFAAKPNAAHLAIKPEIKIFIIFTGKLIRLCASIAGMFLKRGAMCHRKINANNAALPVC